MLNGWPGRVTVWSYLQFKSPGPVSARGRGEWPVALARQTLPSQQRILFWLLRPKFVDLLRRIRRMNKDGHQQQFSDSPPSSPPTPPSPLPISVGPGYYKYCFSSSPSPTPPFSPPLSDHSSIDSLPLLHQNMCDPVPPAAATSPSAFSLDYQDPTGHDTRSSCLRDL